VATINAFDFYKWHRISMSKDLKTRILLAVGDTLVWKADVEPIERFRKYPSQKRRRILVD